MRFASRQSILCVLLLCGVLLLAVIWVSGECAPSIAQGTQAESATSDFEYVETDGGIAITRYKGDASEVVVPRGIAGAYVVTIAAGAFEGCAHVASVTIPSTVTRVEPGAFVGCEALAEVVVPAGPASIIEDLPENCVVRVVVPSGDDQTADAYGLDYERVDDGWQIVGYHGADETLVLPSTHEGEPIVAIADNAFNGCTTLASLEMPNTITRIGVRAFSGCTALRELVLPRSLVEMGWSAFFGCTSLVRVDIPDTLSRIPDMAFTQCTSLEAVEIPEGVTVIGEAAFSQCSSLAAAHLPDSVDTMGEYAFNACVSLTSATLPHNLSAIEQYTFSGCQSLASIEIPAAVSSIDETAFAWCYELGQIAVDEGNPRYEVHGGALYDMRGHVLLRAPSTGMTDFAVEPGCVRIGKNAFSGNVSLERISIPASVTQIGARNFEFCSSLRDVAIDDGNPHFVEENGMIFDKDRTILLFAYFTVVACEVPEGVVAIAPYAFYENDTLVTLDLPTTLASIGEYAFYGCSGLAELFIPDAVTQIGESAFAACESLGHVSLPAHFKEDTQKGTTSLPFPETCDISYR